MFKQAFTWPVTVSRIWAARLHTCAQRSPSFKKILASAKPWSEIGTKAGVLAGRAASSCAAGAG